MAVVNDEAFWIGFVANEPGDEEWQQRGRIQIGEYYEHFLANTGNWRLADYLRQWREGIARVASGEVQSCLVTSLEVPDGSYLNYWPLFVVGDTVYFQQRLMLPEILPDGFRLDRLYELVRARESVNEDGERIWEKSLPLEAVRRGEVGGAPLAPLP